MRNGLRIDWPHTLAQCAFAANFYVVSSGGLPVLYLISENPFHLYGQHQENAMNEFIAKYKEEIQGTLTGFDRLVLAGTLRRLDVCQYVKSMKALRATAMEKYCFTNEIWLKDFAAHVKSVSERIKKGTGACTSSWAGGGWNSAR
jgi:hypothetical protein